MIRDDNPPLGRVEHDLAELARPSPRDDAFRVALRGELAERIGPRRPSPAPRRRLGRRPALVASALAAAAIAATLLLVGTRGAGGPEPASAGVIQLAQRALTPPANSILHVKLVSVDDGLTSESWQLTRPPYSARWSGDLGGGPEVANDGKTEFVFDEDANAIYTRRTTEPLRLSGPVAEVRSLLDSGRARLTGKTTIDGSPVHRISLQYGQVAYVDTATYRPLFIDSRDHGGPVRLRVVELEYLPQTEKTTRLLSLPAQHPRARVRENPAAWGSKP
jgi:hypothetical protein